MRYIIIVSVLLMAGCATQISPAKSELKESSINTSGGDRKITSIYIDETTGSKTDSKSASGTSASSSIISSGDIKDWSAGIPELQLSSINSGQAQSIASIASATKNPMTIFFILSAVSFVIAIPILVYVSKPIGILLFVASAGLLATALLATAAPITFGISILAILGIVGYMYFNKKKENNKDSALKTIVSTIETMPIQVQELIKESIKEKDDGSIKEVVTEVKSKL